MLLSGANLTGGRGALVATLLAVLIVVGCGDDRQAPSTGDGGDSPAATGGDAGLGGAGDGDGDGDGNGDVRDGDAGDGDVGDGDTGLGGSASSLGGMGGQGASDTWPPLDCEEGEVVTTLCDFQGEEALESNVCTDGSWVPLGDCGEVPTFVSHWAVELRSELPLQVVLPLVESGVYDFVVHWGDGTVSRIRDWNAPGTAHIYPWSGEYVVRISGQFEGWSMDSVRGLIQRRLKEISDFGSMALGDTEGAFARTRQLTISALEGPRIGGSLRYAFAGSAYVVVDHLENWDVSGVEDMHGMFWGTQRFTGDLSSWDVSAVRDMSRMFCETYSFDWDFSSWRISQLGDASQMFCGQHLSTESYDALLLSWSVQERRSGVVFSAGPTQYSPAAAEARKLLAETWTVHDGGILTPAP